MRARRKENIRRNGILLLLLRVYGAHASRLLGQAFHFWSAGFEDDQAMTESVVSPPPPPPQHVAAGEILETPGVAFVQPPVYAAAGDIFITAGVPVRFWRNGREKLEL